MGKGRRREGVAVCECGYSIISFFTGKTEGPPPPPSLLNMRSPMFHLIEVKQTKSPRGCLEFMLSKAEGSRAILSSGYDVEIAFIF